MKKLTAIFISTAFATVGATDIHVSPKGDDSADGSQKRPFATMARARDAVRALKKYGALPKGGVNVWLHGGEYPMREPLALGKEDSGVAGAPVAYRAWKGEAPVLTGAWTVPSSAWRLADDPRIPAEAKGKVWMADVKSLTLRAPATTVMRGNVCVPKLPADLSSIPGFESLPPESAIGQRKFCSCSKE